MKGGGYAEVSSANDTYEACCENSKVDADVELKNNETAENKEKGMTDMEETDKNVAAM